MPLDKIKILWKRKPIQGKVADALMDEVAALGGGKEVEFGVMIMGGAQAVVDVDVPDAGPAVPTTAEAEQPPQKWEHSRSVLEGDAFWGELESFLASQVKDEGEAEKLKDIFKSAWNSNR